MAATYYEMIVARLFDFFGRRTPWQRRLWGISTVTGLQEASEAGARVHAAGQGHEHLLSYRRFLAGEVASDLGIIQPHRAKLDSLLRTKTFDQQSIHELDHLTAQVRGGYVAAWRAQLTGEDLPVEGFSRAIASLLLDEGFSPSGLHRWLTGVMSSDSPPLNAQDLLDLVDQRLSLPSRTWRVLVPTEYLPLDGHPAPVLLLNEAQARAALPPERPTGTAGVKRLNGAFCFEDVEAKDEAAAVAEAVDRLGRIAARVAVGLPGTDQMRLSGKAWVTRVDGSGTGRWLELRDPQRAIEVGTLFRQQVVFDLPEQATRLDDALQLLATLESGSPGAGIASSWAVVESLLRGPAERGGEVAAKRLAAIISCSLPRAELTPLAYSYKEENDDALSHAIASAGSNREACKLVEDAVRSQAVVSIGKASDSAALRRLQRMMSDPSSLGRVHRSIEASLLRLYRVRNMVMHGGSARSLVTSSLVRTMPALVGAGVDRIAHGILAATPPVGPLELAARATINLEQVEGGHPSGLSELLEAPPSASR